MKRRTFDLAVPMAYVIVLLITIFSGNATAVGAVAVLGGVTVGVYYAVVRGSIKTQ
jgi:hypothetical protein